jgi:hypothetical protein
MCIAVVTAEVPSSLVEGSVHGEMNLEEIYNRQHLVSIDTLVL